MANWTPLHIAALMLLYGADPTNESLEGKTSLQVAAEQHNEGVVELLATMDSPFAASDILLAAIQCRSHRLVNSFYPDPFDPLDIRAILLLAAKPDDLALIEMTCEKFTSDQIDKVAFDACSAAIDSSRADILKTLLQRGADVQAKGPWRRNLLHLAVGADDISLATTLINHGIDVSAQ
ncbi:hypothetical protein GP486_002351 [Trichoglossum hirsutum]|uniref:Ankyrin repeat protein n=1 Tax=Trichoglossum hirsutum TaxID=265104 RepID=A0A9P8LEX7_9PEZI|nr:hypothetical protein GP486_002351 [Trichoglossum hirsutum]